MKTIRILALGLVALLAAACGKDPNDNPNPKPNTANGYIELTPWRMSLASGQQQRITATVYVDGEALANPKIEWESSDPTIATVDQTGLVTATSDYSKEGSAQVTAVYGQLTAACDVRVSAPVLVKSLSFDPASVTVPYQGTLQLHPIVQPEDANMFNYQWQSDNTSVATVDQDGLVTAVASSGSCNITVTAEGGATASVQVTAVNPFSFKQVSSLDALSGGDVTSPMEVDAQAGEQTVYIRIYDSRTKAFVSDGTKDHFNASFANPDVAFVNIAETGDGNYCYALTCNKTGTADITLTYKYGNDNEMSISLTVNVMGTDYFAEGHFIGMTVGSSSSIVYKNPSEVTLSGRGIHFRLYDKNSNQPVDKLLTWTLESDDGNLINGYTTDERTYSISPRGNQYARKFGLLTPYEQNRSTNLVIKVANGNASITLNLKVRRIAHDFSIAGVDFHMATRWNGGGEDADIVYQMGPIGNKQYTNHLTRFGFGMYEVTQGQWKAVMGSNPSSTDLNIGDNYPVNNISYSDARQFIARLNQLAAADYPGYTFRLPTESEWEYVASTPARNNHPEYLYAGSDDLDKVGWYSVNSGRNIHEVGLKQACDGIYDLSGNVWEWCSDWYADYPTTDQTRYAGPSSGTDRVLRGGSFSNSKEPCQWHSRFWCAPTGRLGSFGMRLALSYPSVVCEGKIN